VATQSSLTVRDFLLAVFRKAGFPDLRFTGTGLFEKLVSGSRVLVEIDPQYIRPGEVPHLLGDSSKIARDLGWESETSLDALIAEMLDYDLRLAGMESQLAKL
jgi:GDP-D-mannose dehydratase